MDLLGIGRDGHLYLWQENGTVQPLTRFPRCGRQIESGHYVIEYRGAAITVHCSNTADGRVSVQYMCGGLPVLYAGAKTLEFVLLGKVVPDPSERAEILGLLRELNENLDAKQTAEHRRRGTLP